MLAIDIAHGFSAEMKSSSALFKSTPTMSHSLIFVAVQDVDDCLKHDVIHRELLCQLLTSRMGSPLRWKARALYSKAPRRCATH